ncbi:TonB-dependent receptor [Bacteroides sp. GM023]|uniref:TonB-dependent receptor plug domain-containing protein n=1 Tax=Bacteroides sp. GM023 TaxID=2723058 RepID=UPI00168ABF25|nr:TonB-dependent receptor plug domain-containing protein [Bacteroides sp. GM023]
MLRYILVVLFAGLMGTNVCAQTETHSDDTIRTDSIWKIQEVEVVASKKVPVLQRSAKGDWKLDPNAVNFMPRMLGDSDPIKTFQLLPGVTTAGELNGGLYVHGSEPGHNLICIDGVPVYNSSHLLGFFSIFNNDHFSSFSLNKSYQPADRGGRLAAVVEMTPRDSIVQRASVSGNVGILASRITGAIPVTPNSALYLSARVTYVNPVISLIEGGFEDNTRLRYGFQDYNLTYVWKPDSKNKIVLNSYVGNDLLKLKEHQYQVDFKIQWLNAIASLKWEHRCNEKVSLTQRVYMTHYRTNLRANQNSLNMTMPSRLTDVGYMGNADWRLGTWKIKSGGTFIHHILRPQYPESVNIFEGINAGNPGRYEMEEFVLYAEAEKKWGNLTMDMGLRYSGAMQNDCYNGGAEPRIRLEYELPEDRILSLSYQLNRQYMNQITVSSAGLPIDFWMPSTKDISGQKVHSLDVSFLQPFPGGDYELLVEGYYRKLYHQTIFNGGLLDMFNQTYRIEDHVLTGEGRNYGVELMLKKSRGRWNGWIGYTLAWADRQFPELREGNTFPAKYDRRHNVNAMVHYTLDDHWDFAMTFVYASGNAVTYPRAMYMIGENAVCVYDEYNSSRMPSYHRMDLSVNYWLGHKKNSCINLSLYNAYMRHNPVFVQVDVKPSKDNAGLLIKKKNMSLYSLLPSVSYIFKF